MSRLPRKITTFCLAVIGLIITPITAKSFNIQRINQSATVVGTNNQVTQEINQIISDSFSINVNLMNNIYNLNESYTGVTFKQYSEQEAFIDGSYNQIIQQVNQTQVNFFDVSVDSLKLEQDTSIVSFVQQVSGLAWNHLPTTEQLSFQDIFIEGENNQVTQQVNQTAISIFGFDTDLNSTSLITDFFQDTFYRNLILSEFNQITQVVNQTSIEVFLFGTDEWMNSLSLEELIDLATESPRQPSIINKDENDISGDKLPPTVPEPTSVISLLALGTIGISVKIYGYFKS